MNLTGDPIRRFRITIRVSARERSALEAAASRAGISLSAYSRRILLHAKPLRAARRPSVEASLLVRVLDQLGRIGAGIRRIEVTLENGPVPDSTGRDLARSLAGLRALRPVLLRALGRRAAAT